MDRTFDEWYIITRSDAQKDVDNETLTHEAKKSILTVSYFFQELTLSNGNVRITNDEIIPLVREVNT